MAPPFWNIETFLQNPESWLRRVLLFLGVYCKSQGGKSGEHVWAWGEKYTTRLIIYLLHMSQLTVSHTKVPGKSGYHKNSPSMEMGKNEKGLKFMGGIYFLLL